MTLIISVGNSEQFIQVSDRRLSVDGVTQDDESNKAGVLNCHNARLAFGFTGLAKVNNFETRKWLLSCINKCGPPDYLAQPTLERLKEEATALFRENPIIKNLTQNQKRLTVMFSGYINHHEPPLGGLAILTNYQNLDTGEISADAWKHFECFFREEPRPHEGALALYYAVGILPPFNSKDKSELDFLLKNRKPAKAIVGKLVNIFHSHPIGGSQKVGSGVVFSIPKNAVISRQGETYAPPTDSQQLCHTSANMPANSAVPGFKTRS